MSTELTPYLNFRGVAMEALEFYGEILGGEVTAITYEQT